MAAFQSLPESVRDFRLQATFHHVPSGGTITTHTMPATRRANREEVWVRERALGVGGFGSVWLEKKTVDDEAIFRAVKEVKKPVHLEKQESHVYARELEALAKFSQEKFATFFTQSYGWFEDDYSVFISMEYCEHGDIGRYLREYGPVPVEDARDIVWQVLQGLVFMHEADFAHRDVKPQNILISERPPHHPSWSVKLCDFGMSKRSQQGAHLTTAVKGTPGYMAPELLDYGGISADPFPCDMWALGEIAFNILMGKPVFDNFLSLGVYVRGESPCPAEDLLSHEETQGASQFIAALMRPKPEQRLTAQQAIAHPWMTWDNIDESPRESGSDHTTLQSNSMVLVHHLDSEDLSKSSSMSGPKTSLRSVPMPSSQDTIETDSHDEDSDTDLPSDDSGLESKMNLQSQEFPLTFQHPASPYEIPRTPVWNALETSQASKSSPRSTLPRPQTDHVQIASRNTKGHQLSNLRSGGHRTGSKYFTRSFTRDESAPYFMRLKRVQGHTKQISAIIHLGDGNDESSPDYDRGWFITASFDKTIRVWSSHTGELQHTFHGESMFVALAAGFGDTFASGSSNGLLEIRSATSRTITQVIQTGTFGLDLMAWSPCKRFFALKYLDGETQIWSKDTLGRWWEFQGWAHSDILVYSPDGCQIAVLSAVNIIHIWSTTKRTMDYRLRAGKDAEVLSAVFSPDSAAVLLGLRTCIQIWSARTGQRSHDIPVPSSNMPVLSLQFTNYRHSGYADCVSWTNGTGIFAWQLEKTDMDKYRIPPIEKIRFHEEWSSLPDTAPSRIRFQTGSWDRSIVAFISGSGWVSIYPKSWISRPHLPLTPIYRNE